MNTPNERQKPLVLVTGSAGLIGTRLIKAMLGTYRVAGLDIESTSVQHDDLVSIECDLTDDASVAEALSTVRERCGSTIASVIHLAAYYDFSGEPSPLYEELTVQGTRRLLQQLGEFDVEQFVFTSTLLVMASSEDGEAVDIHSPLDAEWDYPQSKLKTEQVVAQYRGAIPAVILRLAGAYDVGCHSIPLAQQISRIYEKQLESYVFPGDKSHGQSFVHLHDAIESILAVVKRRGELSGQETFLIGEEDVMSYEELQNRIGDLIHGKEWPTIRIPKTIAKAGAWTKNKLADSEDAQFIKPWMIDLADQNYPIRIERARQRLGWQPAHSLRKSLPEMIRRLEENPHQWYEENGLPVPDSITQESHGAQ